MMRKILCLLCLWSLLPVHALYFGNPSEPDIIEEGFFFSCEGNWGLKIGYQGDLCFDRQLKVTTPPLKGKMNEFSYLMNQGVVTCNLFDLYEVYGSVGAMSATFAQVPSFDFNKREYSTSGHFTWGVGAKAELFHWGLTTLTADGKYQYSQPPLQWNTINGTSYKTSARLHYEEWQIGGGLSHQVDMFVPYIALIYSSVDAKVRHIKSNILPVNHFSMQSRERFGMALGCGLSPSCLVDLNVEVRLFSEQAITLAGNIKF